MFHRIGLDEMPMFRDAVYTERFSARLASVVCVVFSVLLLLAIPFIFLTGLFLGGWHVVLRAKSALFLSSILILALLVFYVVAGAAIWSSRRSIPVRLMRVYPCLCVGDRECSACMHIMMCIFNECENVFFQDGF